MTSLSPPPPTAHDSRAWVFAPVVRGVLDNFVFNMTLFCIYFGFVTPSFSSFSKIVFLAISLFLARYICTHVAIVIAYSRLTPLYQKRKPRPGVCRGRARHQPPATSRRVPTSHFAHAAQRTMVPLLACWRRALLSASDSEHAGSLTGRPKHGPLDLLAKITSSGSGRFYGTSATGGISTIPHLRT